MKYIFFPAVNVAAESNKDFQHTQKPSDSTEQYSAALSELTTIGKSRSTAAKGQVQLVEESISYWL